MIRGFFTFFLFILPLWAFAQSVDVRSGDHNGFTRLVFDIPAGTQWALNQGTEENTYRLDLSLEAANFNVDRAFDRISRDRVSGLAPVFGQPQLDINLACDCIAEAFAFSDRMLVVDIRSNPNPDPISDIEPEPQVVEFEQPVRPKANDVVDSSPSVDLNLAADLGQIRLDGAPGIGPSEQNKPLMPGVTLAHPNQSEKDDSDLQIDPLRAEQGRPLSLADQVIADLAAAATQGLLDPAIEEIVPLTAIVGSDNKPIEALSEQAEGLGESLQKGLADLEHGKTKNRHIAVGGDHCISDKKLRVSDWVNSDEEVFTVLSEQRGRVFGEFDRVEKGALTEYIKMLIYFGFGAEARSAANLIEEDMDPMLRGLSYLVDLDEDPTATFADQSNCAGSAALWAILDAKTLTDTVSINDAAILGAFETLPKHFRAYLGPAIAQKLGDFGHKETARDLLRRLERAQGEESDGVALARARLDIAEGNPGNSAQTLQDLALAPGPDSVEAIKASIDLAEQSDERVPQVMVDLAEAYATELRNTEDGPVLWQAHLRMLLVNRDFSKAFDVYESAQEMTSSMKMEMGDKMLKSVLKADDDVSFLKFAYRLDATGYRTSKPDLVYAVADRMLELGLPEAALERLDRVEADQDPRDVRLLRARAHLLMDRPDMAETYLAGLTGNEPDLLRAQSKVKLGDYASAQLAFSEIGEDQEAMVAAWLSGNWQGVEGMPDSALSSAAQLIQQDQTDVLADDLSLGDAEALFSESVSARETLRAMLQETEIDGASN